MGVDSVPPLWSAFWRMLLGLIVVMLWAYRTGVPLRLAHGERGPLFCLGILFTVQIALLNVASAMTSPAYGVVILNSYAVFAILTGHFLAGKPSTAWLEVPLTRQRTLGLLLALSGVAVLATGTVTSALAPNPGLGNALMALSALFLGVRQVYTRWLTQFINPVRAVVWQMGWSVPLFLLSAVVSEPFVYQTPSWEAIGAIAYQGIIVAGFCFIAWAKLLKRHSAGTLSMYAFLVPISGIALSSFIFGEAIHPQLLIGGVLVLAGVFQVTRVQAPLPKE